MVDNSFFDNGECVETTREIRRYKRQMQSMGINVVVDQKGKVLNGNRAAGFDYATGTIYIYLEREEYVYSRIMDNISLFNEVELAGVTNYIARLLGRN